VKDVKLEDGNLLKIKSFHNLDSESGLTKKLADKKLIDLKIPFDDLLILKKDEAEVQVEFDNYEIFK
ncbi:MAG: hypothetical protein ABI840_13220, partial [bacterium]